MHIIWFAPERNQAIAYSCFLVEMCVHIMCFAPGRIDCVYIACITALHPPIRRVEQIEFENQTKNATLTPHMRQLDQHTSAS